jgi:hypothetical protein
MFISECFEQRRRTEVVLMVKREAADSCMQTFNSWALSYVVFLVE